MTKEVEIARRRLREIIMNELIRPAGGPSPWPAIDGFAAAIEALLDAKLDAALQTEVMINPGS